MGNVDKEKLKKLEAVKLSLEKSFGTGIVSKLNSENVEGVSFLPTKIIEFDMLSGGGFPKGRIIEIYGPESSGKTTLALHAIASAQEAGGVCAFVDMEHALDPVYAQNLGVDIDNLWVSQPESGEQGLEVVEQMVRSEVVDVVVFDSVASAIPQKEIDGDFGDSNMGLQARLMSQAMRKLTGCISKTNCIVIFINQIRMKIGVMFGCFSYNTRVCLSDGTTEKIGKIVNQKLDVEVLSFDSETGLIQPKKIVNYYNNGKCDKFLKFIVEKPYGNGRSQFTCTEEHLIFCKYGEINASDIRKGDYVLGQGKYALSETQKEIIKGSLLGDGCISIPSYHFKIAHSKKQNDYCLYKKSFFENLNPFQYTHAKGGLAFEIVFSEELNEYRTMCYTPKGKRKITREFIASLSDIAIAIWYMDDACLTGSHNLWGNGKIEISLKSYSDSDIEIIRDGLFDKGYGYASIGKRKVLRFYSEHSFKFQEKIAKWIHPSMRYKLAEKFQSVPFEKIPLDFIKPYYKLVPRKVLDISVSTKKGNKFDLEVEGTHTYLVDGIGVHNSPETTCVTPDTMIEIE
jgi:recombination protein RecA